MPDKHHLRTQNSALILAVGGTLTAILEIYVLY